MVTPAQALTIAGFCHRTRALSNPSKEYTSMKKTLVFAALILLAGCTAPSTNRETANSNATAAQPPAAAPLTEAEAIAKEKQVWEVVEKKDYKAFADMLDEQVVSVS